MKTPYFDALIDDFGIWQHTDGTHILEEEGYALDDAARGLITCLALQKMDAANVLFTYVQQSLKDKKFYGFATKDHTFIQYPASADATGQVVWAMGYAQSLGFRADEARHIIDDVLPTLFAFDNLRGYAYALLGTLYTDSTVSKKIYQRLRDFFAQATDDWLWPEDTMTYGNAIIPYAFLRYGLVENDTQATAFGHDVLQFVEQKSTDHRLRGPIGNDGWYPKGAAHVPEYSQQPIDAAYMIWAWIAAGQAAGDKTAYTYAQRWMDWFEGVNVKHEMMYDPTSMQCYDGIDRDGVHYHSGAESNICFLLSKHILATQQSL